MVVQWLGLQASNAGEGGFDPMCCMVEPKTKTKIFFLKDCPYIHPEVPKC